MSVGCGGVDPAGRPVRAGWRRVGHHGAAGLDELADHLDEDGLPDRRLARMLAGVRATAWEEIVAGNQDRLPTVTVAGRPLTHPTSSTGGSDDADGEPETVVRLDATIIDAATMKPGVAGHYKGGIGYHPLTAWCPNIGDHLVAMQRPGNAGSFTAADHVTVLDAALAQIPAEHRSDLLVTIDGPAPRMR